LSQQEKGINHVTVSDNQLNGLHGRRLLITYAIIVAIGALGVLSKQQFGMFLFKVMGKQNTGPQTWVQWLMSDWVLVGVAALACVVHRYSGLPGAPRIEWLLSKETRPAAKPPIWRPGLIGAAICLTIFVASQIYQTLTGTSAPLTAKAATFPHDVMIKLAALYPLAFVGAALSEEVCYRFGLLSLMMGLMSLLGFGGRRRSFNAAFWTANILQAAWFGFAHVQQGIVASQAGGLLWQTAIAPQTWAGIVFGVIFRRRGLEAAIIAHMGTDILVPVVLGLWGLVHH
jgi:hypothetical protein